MPHALRSVAAALALLATTALAGPLDPPPGPITSTQKALAEVEPRIAINLTNTPGDANSLLRITQPGSYYLTGNITGVVGKHGIEIASGGVAIDLNGFDLVGVPGSLDGIALSGNNFNGIDIRNGSVRSWGGEGVDLAFFSTNGATLRDLRCVANTGGGLHVGFNAVVTGCVAQDNGLNGFFATDGSMFTDCAAARNGSDGFNVGQACIVTSCVAYNNDSDGIATGFGCSVSGCVARSNGEHGLRVGTASVITGNMCSGNGTEVADGAGVYVSGADNRIEGNTCVGQDRGVWVNGSGNVIVRNVCSGNTTNWSMVANNVYGPIIDRTAPASPAVSGNAAAGSLGSTDANANFSY